MNGQVEVTWRTLHTVAHYLMVHTRVPEAYDHFALMYTTDHIFPVLPIEYLIKEDGYPTTPNSGNRYETFSVTFTFYFFHVLYVKLRRTLRQRH